MYEHKEEKHILVYFICLLLQTNFSLFCILICLGTKELHKISAFRTRYALLFTTLNAAGLFNSLNDKFVIT